MYRRPVSLLLAVLLMVVSVAVPALADSWTCPSCGKQNDGNFCGSCGTRRPAQTVTAPPEQPLFPGIPGITTPQPADPVTVTPGPATTAPRIPTDWVSRPPTLTPTAPVTLPPSPAPVTLPPSPAPATSTPTPAPVTGTWIRNFTASVDKGQCTVNFRDGYIRDTDGKYYVVYSYYGNEYYSWHIMDPGQIEYTMPVVPGRTLRVGVYLAAPDEEAKDPEDGITRTLTVPFAGTYSGYSFRAGASRLAIRNDSGTEEVTAYALSDLTDHADEVIIQMDWSYRLTSDTRVDMHGVLDTPDGAFYTETCWYTWDARDHEPYYYFYSLKDLLDKAGRFGSLEEGAYRFSLYIDGQTVVSVPFTAGTRRVPAVTPSPTPTPRTSEWVTNFTTNVRSGICTVDFSGYAATHDGTYYVFYDYDANSFYSWDDVNPGKTTYAFRVIPGQPMRVGVYCDVSGGGAPAWNGTAMKRVNVQAPGTYMGHGFRHRNAELIVETNGTAVPVRSYSLSDVTDHPDQVMIRLTWDFSVSQEQLMDVLGVLHAPNGELYSKTFRYNWRPGSGATFRQSLASLLELSKEKGTLTQGSYLFEMFIEGQRAASVPFTVGTSRVLVATPTPKPTPKPTATKTPTPKPRTFRILAPSMSNGATTISWEDSANNGPYTVLVQHEYKSGSQTKLAAAQQFARTNSKSATNGYVMAPGEPYTITVRDGSGASVTYSYKPTPRNYPDFSISIDIDLKTKTPKGTKNQKSLSAADIRKNLGSYTYGAYVRLGYSQIRYERTTNWTMAFHIPNGDVYVDMYQVDTIPAGHHYTYYPHYPFNGLFQYLMDSVGSIPAGTYRMTLYFDGQKSGSSTFTVTQ